MNLLFIKPQSGTEAYSQMRMKTKHVYFLYRKIWLFFVRINHQSPRFRTSSNWNANLREQKTLLYYDLNRTMNACRTQAQSDFQVFTINYLSVLFNVARIFRDGQWRWRWKMLECSFMNFFSTNFFLSYFNFRCGRCRCDLC